MDLTVDLTLVCTITDKIDVFEAAWITTSGSTARRVSQNEINHVGPTMFSSLS
jgi:hypothetical protein